MSALDVLVVRVHELVPKDVWKPRYDFINEWEKLLAIENSTTILKFFLYISREEQLTRFKERLNDPGRQWKISNSDYTERNLWEIHRCIRNRAVPMFDQIRAVVCRSFQSQMVS